MEIVLEKQSVIICYIPQAYLMWLKDSLLFLHVYVKSKKNMYMSRNVFSLLYNLIISRSYKKSLLNMSLSKK